MIAFNHVPEQVITGSGGKGMFGACYLNICKRDSVVKKNFFFHDTVLGGRNRISITASS